MAEIVVYVAYQVSGAAASLEERAIVVLVGVPEVRAEGNEDSCIVREYLGSALVEDYPCSGCGERMFGFTGSSFCRWVLARIVLYCLGVLRDRAQDANRSIFCLF
jgi:hypothetical protein